MQLRDHKFLLARATLAKSTTIVTKLIGKINYYEATYIEGSKKVARGGGRLGGRCHKASATRGHKLCGPLPMCPKA